MKASARFYERKGAFLAVIGSLPKWLIVDQLGKQAIEAVLSEKNKEVFLQKFGAQMEKKEAARAYDEIAGELKLVEGAMLPSHDLTQHTSVAMVCVTRRCNMACPHCYVDANGQRGTELNLAEHASLARQMEASLAPNPYIRYSVNITGGEPFCHSDILGILDSYRFVGFDLTMSTNGSLIKKEQIPFLVGLQVALSISLDGAKAATHEMIRGKGTFAKTVSIIRELVEAGARVGINCLIHTGNIDELEVMLDQAWALGCNGFNPINVIRIGRAKNSTLLRVSEASMFKKFADYIRQNPERAKLLQFSSQFGALGSALLAGITCDSCGVGVRKCVYVSEAGDVFPCPNTQFPQFLLGNIRDVPLDVCIPEDHPVLRKMADLRVDSINAKCASCDVRYFCGGDCRGETYSSTGLLTAPSPSCIDRHDSLIELMWIVASQTDIFQARADEYSELASI